MIPLMFVIRKNHLPTPAACPANAPNKPHSNIYGSVKEELIQRCSHDHPSFSDDNESVYLKLEEATRDTKFSTTIKSFKKDGRGAYMALIAQHAGDDKWQDILRKGLHILHSQKWNGQSNYSLEKHCQAHRSAYNSIVEAAMHIPYEVPNEHSRVSFLLESLNCKDPELLAATAFIKQNHDLQGPRFHFEAAVACILPEDPVARRRTEP